MLLSYVLLIMRGCILDFHAPTSRQVAWSRKLAGFPDHGRIVDNPEARMGV
jgi:hypothetical protein